MTLLKLQVESWVRPAQQFIDGFAALLIKHRVRWCGDLYLEFMDDPGTCWEVYIDKESAHIRPVSWDGPTYGEEIKHG